ncbi:PREDICTED: uncharacterized protein LOC106809513 [Priapulus caudatus]|uniref:Uncharacterized protein LOC106809513 n=1 Tax=Priapulus caudatus TaxID=37621 RepID=A0ABM1E7C2_PRICU|nr:PREDICTED: uncharacterized protein LOC106809513 [Priapulus caudatus]
MWWFLLYQLLLLITGFLTPGIVIALIVEGMVVVQEMFRAAKALTAFYVILSFVAMLGAVGTLCYASAVTPSAFLLWGYSLVHYRHPTPSRGLEQRDSSAHGHLCHRSAVLLCRLPHLRSLQDGRHLLGNTKSLVTEQPKVPVRKTPLPADRK